MALCRRCAPLGSWVMQNIAEAMNYSLDLSYRHSESWACLLDSAAKGCPFCQHIRAYFHIRGSYKGFNEQVFDSNTREAEDPRPQTWVEQIHDYEEAGYTTTITISLVANRDGYLSLPITCAEVGYADTEQGLTPYLSLGDPAAYPSTPLRSKAHLNANPMSSDTMAIVKVWLADCMHNHEPCRPLDAGFIPMRLIDVGTEGENPFLLETNNIAKYASYVALSHCWGKTQHVRTTLDNLAQHRRALPYNELSKTFKDAFLLTQQVGLRYIWIDSLCIIQDSAEDWAVNAADMGTIYASSALTIAATDAPDGAHGFLNPRQAPCALPYTISDPVNGDLHGELWIDSWGPYFYDHIPTSVINSRAWVTQERHLPSRLLHAGNFRLMWECQTQVEVECNPQFAIRYEDSGYIDKVFAPQLLKDPVNDGVPQKRLTELYDTWRFLVEDYSKKDLTFIKDRLPAVSGLAKLFQRATLDEYCAGLWLGDVPYALCWEPSIPWKRTDIYTAPSWSWASFATGVSYPPIGEDSASFLEEIEISTRPVTDTNPLGAVSEGYLRCSGLVRPAALVPTPDGPTKVNLEIDVSEAKYEFLGTTDLERSYDFNLRPMCLLVSERQNWRPNKVSQSNKKLARVNTVLLLEAVQNLPDTYRRIGVISHATYCDEWSRTKRNMITII